jgi:hypothetical protein
MYTLPPSLVILPTDTVLRILDYALDELDDKLMERTADYTDEDRHALQTELDDLHRLRQRVGDHAHSEDEG